MIGRLKGIILEKQPPLTLLEVGGVGYEVRMPMTCFYELPNTGSEVIIFIHFFVRENVQLLFGFNSKQERAVFRELIKTNGIGSKLALIILSELSVEQFVHSIEFSEISALTKIPGIGKKTAERLIVEMKGRFKTLYNDISSSNSSLTLSSCRTSVANDAEQEAVAALMALGYKPQEASRLVSNVSKSNNSSEALIRAALRAVL